MKRFLFSSFILLALIVGTTGVASVAHAQACLPDGSNAATCIPSDDATIRDRAGVTNTQAAADASAASAGEKTAASIATDNKGTVDDAYNTVMQKIMSLFAWLVGVAAILLDNVVYYTVVKMGDFVHKLSAVGVTWRILRDIGNIMLIFGFIAVGMTTIMNVEWYGGGKKMLPMMLVAAVFLNFSLFISEAIIDTGNLFATQFYTQINGGNPAGVKSFDSGSFTFTTSNEGISNKIMSQLGLQTIYGEVRTNPDVLKGANSWFIGFMGIILFIVTAFVLFSLSFVLIARFVALIFLIILAPVGFAGLAIPGLEARMKKYWETLFQQTITAPILLLMLYIALAVITDAQFLTGMGGSGRNWLGFVNGNNFTGFAGMLLSFLVAMGLLLAVVIQSKNLSAFGAAGASKLAGKLTFGATAFAGRTTVGWGANRTAKYLRSTVVGRVPLVGTGLVKGLDKVAGGSFDVRGSKAFGGLKDVGLGIDAGVAQKGGYKADLKSRIESRTKYAKDLTGRELTDEQKIDQKVVQDAIKATEKRLAEAQVRQRAMVARGENTQIVDDEIAGEKEVLAGHQTRLNSIEEVTDKGAQRKYASNLELGLGDKSTFNKYFNFAANTEAAKTIRKEAKKSSDDQTLDALKKALKKAGGEEEGNAPAPAAPAPAAPAGP